MATTPSTPHPTDLAIVEACTPPPGCRPYLNERPVGVAARHDGATLLAFLTAVHPNRAATWGREIDEGRITVDGQHRQPDFRLTAGNLVRHRQPGHTEPPVAVALSTLYEDDRLWVFNKPAPLPVHPSGRFNKNSVTGLLQHTFQGCTPKPVHRLDADTTGVLVVAKEADAARQLAQQFSGGVVSKRYLALVAGAEPRVGEIRGAIGARPQEGGTRQTEPEGKPAITRIESVTPHGEQRWLVELTPITGRTNQLRLHMQLAGHGIVGDSAYSEGVGANEALTRGGLCLHAASLELTLPGAPSRRTFRAPTPSWA